MLESGLQRENNKETNKQQQNFTIPAKIFCRVRESMQETGQQRRRRWRRAERERRQEAEWRKEGERGKRLEHEKP